MIAAQRAKTLKRESELARSSGEIIKRPSTPPAQRVIKITWKTSDPIAIEWLLKPLEWL